MRNFCIFFFLFIFCFAGSHFNFFWQSWSVSLLKRIKANEEVFDKGVTRTAGKLRDVVAHGASRVRNASWARRGIRYGARIARPLGLRMKCKAFQNFYLIILYFFHYFNSVFMFFALQYSFTKYIYINSFLRLSCYQFFTVYLYKIKYETFQIFIFYSCVQMILLNFVCFFCLLISSLVFLFSTIELFCTCSIIQIMYWCFWITV